MGASIRQASHRDGADRPPRGTMLQWLLALIALMLLLGFCHRWLAAQQVDHVHIEGNMTYTDRASMQAAVSPWLSQGMLHLPIRQIRSAVLADKWVDDVQLRKQWPNTLVLHVAEQRPVASWQQNAYLNYRGEAFSPKNMIAEHDLPALSGPKGKGALILQVYQHLSAVTAPRGLRVTVLAQDRIDNFMAELSNGMVLRLGDVDVKQNINKFAAIFDRHLEQSTAAVASVDLRYSNGAAVAWQQDAGLALAATTAQLKPQGEFYER